MSLDNFKIVLQDGTTYDMAEDFSVLVRSFRISSPNPSRQTEQIDGRDGQIRLGKDYGPREITAPARSLRSTMPTRYYYAMK
jgi:hypothetical protein